VNPTELRALLDAHGVHPSRALGQNFLVDPNTARRIVRLAGVRPGDHVVEIGPGAGSLTVALADAGASVRAVELDRHLLPVLDEVIGGRDVEVVTADAMAADWPALLADASPWLLVANLPYNVATPVVLRCLETAPMIERMLVMVQREVGERLAAPVGGRQYGAVTVKVAYFAAARLVGVVPPTVFTPRPKVDSALVEIVRHAPPVAVDDAERMFALVRAGFATRRKTLRNALAVELGDRVDAVLDEAGIDRRRRAETLTLADWAQLAHAEAALA
jgi:16S rRNA (adenine1518-N6/adenine1519-N6)-dimethyltransferase